MSQVLYDYTRADASGASCVAHAWAKVPEPLTPSRRRELKSRIAQQLTSRDAVLVAHYYVDGDLQDLAQETGGCVADSLEMARFGRDHAAKTLIVAGVRFMGETAKILSPHKRVLMPDLEATCSLDLSTPSESARLRTPPASKSPSTKGTGCLAARLSAPGGSTGRTSPKESTSW